jgi:hypothetical protein
LTGRTLLALVLGVLLAGPAQLPSQVAGYITKGACPFECCTYGVWPVLAATDVRTGPDSTSRVIAALRKGDSVEVVTGEVHVLPGLARVTGRPHSSAADLDPDLPIEILDYIGEGYSRVRQGTRVSQVKIARTKARCRESPNWRYCWVDVVREPVSVWWVTVRLSDSRIGWVRVDGGLKPKDACG